MKLYLLAIGLCIPTTSFSMHYLAKVYNYTSGHYNKQLLQAVDTSDKDGVINALKRGANVNYQTPRPVGPGHLGHRLRTKQKVATAYNKWGQDKGSALHRCAATGNTEIARILLDAGANTLLQRPDGHLPLYIAAQNGHSDMLQLLLQHTPDSTLKAVSCKRALAKQIKKAECDTILKHYLKQRKQAALQHILADKQKQVTHFTVLPQEILTLITAHAANTELEKKLWAAISTSNLHDAQSALSAGAHVNTRDSRKATPLHLAVTKNKIAIARLLLNYGADVNAQQSYGGRPLHQDPTKRMARLLATYGAHPFIKVDRINTRIAEDVMELNKQVLRDAHFFWYFLPNILKKQEALIKILQTKNPEQQQNNSISQLPQPLLEYIAQKACTPSLPSVWIQNANSARRAVKTTISVKIKE